MSRVLDLPAWCELDPDRLVSLPMALEEFLDLPEGVRAEWVDGETVVTPPPRSSHNRAQFRLARLFDEALGPGVNVVTESGWRRDDRYRIPDVMVFDVVEDVVWYDRTPLVVAEVLSPSTRAEDTLRKSAEYLDAGVGQYWILDPAERTLVVLAPADRRAAWTTALALDDSEPLGRVSAVGAVVDVDMRELLR